jgi:hypothetical protein
MSNLREVIEANIAKAQAEVDKYKADLAALEAEGGNWLERDLKELQDWVQKLASHLFSPAANEVVVQNSVQPNPLFVETPPVVELTPVPAPVLVPDTTAPTTPAVDGAPAV